MYWTVQGITYLAGKIEENLLNDTHRVKEKGPNIPLPTICHHINYHNPVKLSYNKDCVSSSLKEAITDARWTKAMEEEMSRANLENLGALGEFSKWGPKIL